MLGRAGSGQRGRACEGHAHGQPRAGRRGGQGTSEEGHGRTWELTPPPAGPSRGPGSGRPLGAPRQPSPLQGASPAGGCLLALSCDYRILADNPKYTIGLNETQLGIVAPFW